MSEKLRRMCALFGILLFLSYFVLVPYASSFSKYREEPGWRVFSLKFLNQNNWEIWIDNKGRFGYDPQAGGNAGGFWPKGTQHNYIFGAGVWVGTIAGASDTMVSYSYNPNSGQSIMGPCSPNGDEATGESDPLARVYLSNDPLDKAVWPVKDAQGRALIRSVQDSWTIFNDVDPQYHEKSTRPMGVQIVRTTYAWPYAGYKDIVFLIYDITNVTGKWTKTKEIFNQFVVANCMDNDIGNEAGARANDLLEINMSYYRRPRKIPGKPDSVTRNLAMQFQLANETGWGNPPVSRCGWIYNAGWIGVRFFESPKATDTVVIWDPDDPEPQYNRTVLPGEELGMTAFKFFTLQTDPKTASERYQFLRGIDYQTKIYNPYEFTPRNRDPKAGDKRLLQCSGPFKMYPDSTVRIVMGICAAIDSCTLIPTSDKAQDIYDANFEAPFPPAAPRLSVIPGDHRVTLVWDNLSEITPDPYYNRLDTATFQKEYRQYDFEGYRVYKAKSEADLTEPTKRTLLAQFDLKDGFTTVLDADSTEIQTPRGVIKIPKWDTLGTDTGLRYTFTDSGQVDKHMVNGIPYYYGVVGFDYQFNDSLYKKYKKIQPKSPTTLEGSPIENMRVGVPRSNPSNYTFGIIQDSTGWNIVGGAYGSTIKYKPRVVIPDSITGHTYQYIWGASKRDTLSNPIIPIYYLTIKNANTGRIIQEGEYTVDTLVNLGHWIGAQNRTVVTEGIEFDLSSDVYPNIRASDLLPFNFKAGTMTVPLSYSQRDTVKPDTSGTMSRDGNVTIQAWAFRGSLFKITWHKRYIGGGRGDSVWIEVRDSTNRVDVPAEPGRKVIDMRQSSWALGADNDSVGYTWFDSTHTGANIRNGKKRGKWLYLCGYRYLFNYKVIGASSFSFPMTSTSDIQDGEVWYIQQKGQRPPVEGNIMSFTTTTSRLTSGNKSVLDRILVVPNPYIVRNPWDPSKEVKHLQFTHLPQKCTIRIYTMAGDFIDKIEHNGSTDIDTTGSNSYQSRGGTAVWDVLTRNDQRPASGVYIFHVDAPGIGTKIGKFAIIH